LKDTARLAAGILFPLIGSSTGSGGAERGDDRKDERGEAAGFSQGLCPVGERHSGCGGGGVVEILGFAGPAGRCKFRLRLPGGEGGFGGAARRGRVQPAAGGVEAARRGRSGRPAGRQAAAAHAPDVVLVDVRLPDANGLTLFEALRADDPQVAVIFLTGHADVPTAVGAMRAGAADFLEKPVDLTALDAAVRRAAEHARLAREVAVLRARDTEALWEDHAPASGLRAATSAEAKSAVPRAPITSRPGRNFRVAGFGVPSVSMNMGRVLTKPASGLFPD